MYWNFVLFYNGGVLNMCYAINSKIGIITKIVSTILKLLVKFEISVKMYYLYIWMPVKLLLKTINTNIVYVTVHFINVYLSYKKGDGTVLCAVNLSLKNICHI